MKRKLAFLLMSLLAVSAFAAGTNKPTCAVLTFDAKGGIPRDQAELLTERFSTEFGKLGQYRLMSRDKMAEILKAQQFSRSDNCSASECALEAGKMLAIQYIVGGPVGHLGKTYTANASLANVESGETERPVSHDIQGEIDEVLTKGMEVTARKLVGLAVVGSPVI